MKKISQTTSKTATTYHLTQHDIISMLKETGRIDDLAEIKRIAFKVPGGGDYSNMVLDIDESDPIIVIVED